MSTNVAIASRALARLGESSISSFDEDSDRAEKVSLLYESTILSLLSQYDWRFAMTKLELAIDGAALPVNKWQRGFKLPILNTDRVGSILKAYPSAEVGAPVTFEYEIQDLWVMTNHTILVVEYVQRKAESLWPGYFVKLAIEACAAAFALPITENQTKDQYHHALAYGNPGEGGRGGMMKTAMEADAAGNPTRGLLDDHDIMTGVRFGGYF